MGLRTCSSKEEAIQAAEAGLLWINMGTHTAPSWIKRYGLNVAKHYGDCWRPADFAVLVEDDEECDSSPPVSKD